MMTDYSKWKVTDLKAELKRRGIAQTGLRVKQQFIDKLVEEDTKISNGEPNEDSITAQEDTQKDLQAPVQPEPDIEDAKTEQKEQVEDPASNNEKDEPKGAESNIEEPPSNEDAPGQLSGEPQVDSTTDRPQSPTKTEGPDSIPQESAGANIPSDTRDKSSEEEANPVEQTPKNTVGGEQESVVSGDTASLPAEKAGPCATLVSEVNTELSTPLPNDEVLEDRRKRKRRSQSPVPTGEDISRKKAKAKGEVAAEVVPEGKNSWSANQAPRQEVPSPSTQAQSHLTASELSTKEGEEETPSLQDDIQDKKSAHPKQDVRFKDLFAPTDQEPAHPLSPPIDTVMGEAEVEPALHAATAALYVDGLMRPLQPTALRNHLVTLATPPNSSANSESIVDFYLDPIKTHCFVRFINVSTACRVRASLHGTVWPNERNRKSLFVDFFPEHKMQDWIHLEEQSRQRGGPPPRWEVKYDRTDDGVKAELEEVNLKNSGSHTSHGPGTNDFARPPPRGPKADMIKKNERPSAPPAAGRNSQPGQGFKPLDELFMSTTAKPKLYYLPVPREVADRRLDRFDDLLQKGSYPRRGGDEARRITFEDSDLFVDAGPEFPSRARGGRGRGRGRGGGMADSWRDSRRD